MLFGKRQRSAATRGPAQRQSSEPPELYAVAYERMLKGNKLMRRGSPIRQAAVVVGGTVRIITSGEMVERKTYEALIEAGILAPDGGGGVAEVLEPDGPADSDSNAV